MLKLLMAQMGLTIDQAQVDAAMADMKGAFQSVKDMKASQDRCEAMLKILVATAHGTPAQVEALISDASAALK